MYRDETKNLVNFSKNINWELFAGGVISFSQTILSSSDISIINNTCTVLDDKILSVISNKHSLYYLITFRFYSNAFSKNVNNKYFSVFLPSTLDINNITYNAYIISAWYDASNVPNLSFNQVLYPDLDAANGINFRTLSGNSMVLTGDILGGMQFTAVYCISNFSDALI